MSGPAPSAGIREQAPSGCGFYSPTLHGGPIGSLANLSLAVSGVGLALLKGRLASPWCHARGARGQGAAAAHWQRTMQSSPEGQQLEQQRRQQQ